MIRAMIATLSASLLLFQPAVAESVLRYPLGTTIIFSSGAPDASPSLISTEIIEDIQACPVNYSGERRRTRTETTWSNGDVDPGEWSDWIDTCVDDWATGFSQQTLDRINDLKTILAIARTYPAVNRTILTVSVANSGNLPSGWTLNGSNELVDAYGSAVTFRQFGTSIEFMGVNVTSATQEYCRALAIHRADAIGINGLPTFGGHVDGTWTNTNNLHPVDTGNLGQVTDPQHAAAACTPGTHLVYFYSAYQ